jgi:PleD family two-component response regulator
MSTRYDAFKVLVADDSPVYRKLVEQTLGEEPWSLLFAKSGGEAMKIFAEHRLLHELALTDSLTTLPNRRAIEDWATRQLSGAARYGFHFGS